MNEQTSSDLHTLALTLLVGQISHPGVDQESLSGSGRAAHDNLGEQSCSFGDSHGLEVHLQRPFLACTVFVINLIHDSLKDKRKLKDDDYCCFYSFDFLTMFQPTCVLFHESFTEIAVYTVHG